MEGTAQSSLSSAPSLWKLGGLTPIQLIKLAYQKINSDQLGTRSSSLSYYFILALFPMLLFLVSLVGVFAGRTSHFRETILSAVGGLAPGSASALIHNVVDQTFKSGSGIKVAFGIIGALWAASGGMSAVVGSLNVIYQTPETRPWWKQKVTVIGLTLALAGLILAALTMVLYGGLIGGALANHIGLGSAFRLAWRVLEWPVAIAAMLFSYSVVYYFGPNLEERQWYWVTPGAAVGVAIWLLASLGFRIYLHFFNTYTATYGSLGAVIILLLWLYITGFAILVGGEVNWVIENEDKRTAELERKKRELNVSLKAA